jgi:hypothetical protein
VGTKATERSSAPHCGRCGRSVEEHQPPRVGFRAPAALSWLIRYAAPSIAVVIEPERLPDGCPGYETPYQLKENHALQRRGTLTKRSGH